MAQALYCIISETTEDRFGEVASLDEAVRIARSVVREGRPGDPISIEYDGKVIRQFVLTAEGRVEEELTV